MARKKPWSGRAKSRQSIETIKEKHVWKLAPRMFYGGMVQIITASCYATALGAAVIFYFSRKHPADDPYAPGYWEVILPTLTQAAALGAVFFLLSLAITLPGKRRMKRLLLPTRCQRCPKCFYDLSARPRDQDTCPECGITAPRRECVRLWCKLLRSRF